jgi:hypothetical protein
MLLSQFSLKKSVTTFSGHSTFEMRVKTHGLTNLTEFDRERTHEKKARGQGQGKERKGKAELEL